MASIDASTSGAGGIITTADNTGILNLQTAGTNAVTINASQNVGIGTTSPASKLTISGSSGTEMRVIYTPSTGQFVDFGSGGVGHYIYGYGTYPLYFGTNGTERMRIDSSGNVLAGVTTYGFNSTNYGIALQPYGESLFIANTPGNLMAFNRNNDGQMFKFFRSGAQVGTVTVTSTATSYNSGSDYRLKENIVPMTGALDKVAQLKPITFKWKVDGSDGQGFIAHELQSVVPDCVTGEKDAVDAEGNPQYQGVDTSFLVATLTAAIQEQQTIINDLKARVTALEAK